MLLSYELALTTLLGRLIGILCFDYPCHPRVYLRIEFSKRIPALDRKGDRGKPLLESGIGNINVHML